jgi:hypothetical protein
MSRTIIILLCIAVAAVGGFIVYRRLHPSELTATDLAIANGAKFMTPEEFAINAKNVETAMGAGSKANSSGGNSGAGSVANSGKIYVGASLANPLLQARANALALASVPAPKNAVPAPKNALTIKRAM